MSKDNLAIYMGTSRNSMCMDMKSLYRASEDHPQHILLTDWPGAALDPKASL